MIRARVCGDDWGSGRHRLHGRSPKRAATGDDDDGVDHGASQPDVGGARMGAAPVFYCGCGTFRMYGRGDCQPSGYVAFASSSETEPAMITSSPFFQFHRRRDLVLRGELHSQSTTRSTWSKERPVVIG